MKWFTIQRADGKYYSDQKELVATVGPQWVNTASGGSLFWGHKGEPTVTELRKTGIDCELVPVEVTVRKGKLPASHAKPTRSRVCAQCGSPRIVGGRCTQCGSDMVKPT